MKKIDIAGRGNVGTHLHKALADKADVKMIDSRTLAGIRPDTDMVIIAVSDRAIAEVASRISGMIDNDDIPVVHTSGTTGSEVLKNLFSHYGVIYPMQTFSRDVPLEYSEIPFFVEASDPLTDRVAREVCSLMTNRIYSADSTQRRALHLGAVLSCNFANHLWTLADRFLRMHGLSFEMMGPLVSETVRKALLNNPGDVQTGPAARQDFPTIQAHIDMLENDGRLKQIYTILSQSIIDTENERNKL